MRSLRVHTGAVHLVPLFATLFFVALAASEAAAPRASEAEANPSGPSSQAYRIAAGDLVSITVWGQEQFSQDSQVNGVGTISYPLLGDINAAGLTCLELQAQLEAGLKQYLKRPQVLVRVLRYSEAGTSVFVIGEVNAPGVYPLSGTMGLMQVLAAAGGTTSRASDEITVVEARTGEIRTVGMEEVFTELQSPGSAAVAPGDVVVVNGKPKAAQQRRYTVLGEVPKPGMYDIPADTPVTVLDAMEAAGMLRMRSDGRREPHPMGMDEPEIADLEHALLTRGDILVPLNLVSLIQGDMSQNLLLQEGDVLTIPRRPLMSVYALGEVRNPGKHNLSSGSTVMSLLNATGAVTSSANLAEATVLRVVEGQPTAIHVDLAALLRHADPEQNIVLQEGDALFVPCRGEKRNAFLRFVPIIPYLLN